MFPVAKSLSAETLRSDLTQTYPEGPFFPLAQREALSRPGVPDKADHVIPNAVRGVRNLSSFPQLTNPIFYFFAAFFFSPSLP